MHEIAIWKIFIHALSLLVAGLCVGQYITMQVAYSIHNPGHKAPKALLLAAALNIGIWVFTEATTYYPHYNQPVPQTTERK